MVNSEALALLNDPAHGLVVIDLDGEPRIMAATLATQLGYPRTERLWSLVHDSERGMMEADTPGGRQKAYYVTLPGLFRAIGSRTPSRIPDPEIRAKVERFQDWVYGEVVPAIYSTGHYNTPDYQEDLDMAITSLDVTIGTVARVADREFPDGLAKDRFMRAMGLLAAEVGRTVRVLGTKADPDYDYNAEWPDVLTNVIENR